MTERYCKNRINAMENRESGNETKLENNYLRKIFNALVIYYREKNIFIKIRKIFCRKLERRWLTMLFPRNIR